LQLNEFNRLQCAFSTTRVVQYYYYRDVRVTILAMTSDGIIGKTFSKVCTKTSCMRDWGILMRNKYAVVGLPVPQSVAYLIQYNHNIMTETCSRRFKRQKNSIFFTQYGAKFNAISDSLYYYVGQCSENQYIDKESIEKGLSPMALQ